MGKEEGKVGLVSKFSRGQTLLHMEGHENRTLTRDIISQQALPYKPHLKALRAEVLRRHQEIARRRIYQDA